MRELTVTHSDLAKRLAELEDKTEALVMSHDTFAQHARPAQAGVRGTARTDDSTGAAQRPIGLVTHDDHGKKTASKRD